MTGSREQHWDNVYATKAETTVSWYEPSADLSLKLIARTGVAKSAPILDVGAGVSHLPEGLLKAGYTDITVLDVSAEAIQRLTTRQAPGAPVRGIVADVTSWQPDRAYGLWHDRAVLHFLIDEADRAAYRRTLLAALARDGHAIIATFAPSGPERCSGLPVRRYGAADLQALFGETLTLRESIEFDHQTPGGATQRFHVAWLQRR